MSSEQHRIREFLDAELLHSLGSYRVARNALLDLEERIKEGPEGALHALVGAMKRYNGRLHRERHSVRSTRHPAPDRFPWSIGGVYQRGIDSVESDTPAVAPPGRDWIRDYYGAAVEALELRKPIESKVPATRVQALTKLRTSLLMPREGAPSGPGDTENEVAIRRLARYAQRQAQANADPVQEARDPESAPLEILNTDLDGLAELPEFVLSAFVEAHLHMHGVESLLAQNFVAHLRRDRGEVETALSVCIARLTFVYSIARACPWIFAENRAEAATMIQNQSACWNRMVPSVCMWISAQLALLALHRRAYARGLMGDKLGAYNDYYKLQRQVRDTGRRVRMAPVHVFGAVDFLATLDALADYHIGELYREDHAHTAALRHFNRSDARLEGLTADPDQPDDRERGLAGALINSRWRIELRVGTGKACYELGQHKESLSWYLKAWQAFLELYAHDNAAEVNPRPIEAAMEWLAGVAHEPVIYKDDLNLYIGPVADQLGGIRIDRRLVILAADILTRIGHLLFVLRPDEPADWHRDAQPPPPVLAFLLKAVECDNANTLLGSDLLKLAYRLTDEAYGSDQTRDVRARLELMVSRLDGLGQQWQGGGDDFERVSRATEYLLLRELLAQAQEKAPTDRRVARRLLAGVFMHTDSINVRRSQIHEHLMREKRMHGGPSLFEKPALEFVCMRRFSSSFPLLPRPAAFRSLAGGYFVRVHTEDEGNPYGIVIDPGTDFIENMFRTDYSVADIDMIVVTHDHVDHMASLEPLLALLFEQGEMRGDERAKSLPLLGNRSVLMRHRNIERYSQLKLYGLSETPIEWDAADWVEERKPKPLTELNVRLSDELGCEVAFTAVSSQRSEHRGHGDLCGNPAHGFTLRVGGTGGPSMAFTSDMPRPHGRKWMKAVRPLLQADMLVAHLSSLPLTELRQAAGLGDRLGATVAERADRKVLLELFAEAEEDAKLDQASQQLERNLASRLAYAYWLGRNPSTRAKLVGPGRLRQWSLPAEHLYFGGLLSCAHASFTARSNGLFVIGELSEEIGSLRSKVAHWINQEIRPSEQTPWKAITADIGLTTFAGRLKSEAGSTAAVRLLCTTCDLDNDLADRERYHEPADVREVCVKGENEGVFYNCGGHDPGNQDPPAFLERLERYDIFGR